MKESNLESLKISIEWSNKSEENGDRLIGWCWINKEDKKNEQAIGAKERSDETDRTESLFVVQSILKKK